MQIITRGDGACRCWAVIALIIVTYGSCPPMIGIERRGNGPDGDNQSGAGDRRTMMIMTQDPCKIGYDLTNDYPLKLDCLGDRTTEVFVVRSGLAALPSVKPLSLASGASLKVLCNPVRLPSPSVLLAMAAKRKTKTVAEEMAIRGHKRAPGSSSKRQTRQATRAQLLAQEEADRYKEHVPLKIRLEVDRMVEELWEEAKAMPKDQLRDEVADWVLDPGSTAGRASAYDRMILTYWVTVRLVGLSASIQNAKQEGDEVPIPAWKEHHGECHTMHHKLDVLAARLGFPFHPADRRALEIARPREKSERCAQERPGTAATVRPPTGPRSPQPPTLPGMQPPVTRPLPADSLRQCTSSSGGQLLLSQFRHLC